LNTVLFQFFIALSFGLRVLVAQHWPLTGTEAHWIDQWSLLSSLGPDALLPCRWVMIIAFFVFILCWGQACRQHHGSFSIAPLLLFHLFPVGLFSGAVLNLFPFVGIVFFGAFRWDSPAKKISKIQALAYVTLGLLTIAEPKLGILWPGFIVLELQRRGFSKNIGLGLFFIMCTMFFYIFLGPTKNFNTPFALGFFAKEEWGILLGLIFFSIVLWLRNDRADRKSQSAWAFFVLPLSCVIIFGDTPSSSVLIPLWLCLTLSWIHQAGLKNLSRRYHFALLCFAFVAIVHSGSQTLSKWYLRYETLSEFHHFALETPKVLEEEPQLLLCEDPELTAILKLTLGREVLTYPSDTMNTSYKYLGASGVWIHTLNDKVQVEKHPHFQGLQAWKDLRLGKKLDQKTFRFEKFDRLILPF
jgi:hypothetical protein